jgi:hypothetical protein
LKHAITARARTARLAVGLLALAVPFVAASVAQGAIGGTSPAKTTGPDLVSGNIVAANFVQLCFDQPVDVTGDGGAGSVRIGGYKTSENSSPPPSVGSWALGSAPVSLGNNCIRTQVGATDLEAYTVVSIDEGVVKNEADATTNLEDSAPLIGSTTKSGTRGNSTGPDLQSTILLGPENQIVYTFDQEVRCTSGGQPESLGPDFFGFQTADGVKHFGDSFPATGACDTNQVVVQFDTSDGDNVSQARSAWADRNAVYSDHFPLGENTNPLFSVDAGGGGISTSPDLRSAELVDASGASNQMAFTFDQAVDTGSPGDFTAVYSDSPNEEYGDQIANVVNGGKTVIVNFNDLNNRTEYIVGGSVSECAVDESGSTSTDCNSEGGKPSGDNSGAFALGWTTGPDAVSATVNQGLGQVRVLVDQRYSVESQTCAALVNSDGQTFSSATATSDQGSLSAPNVVPVTYSFDQDDLADAVGLQMLGAPTTGQFNSCTSLSSPRDDTEDTPTSGNFNLFGAPAGPTGPTNLYDNVDQVFSIR